MQLIVIILSCLRMVLRKLKPFNTNFTNPVIEVLQYVKLGLENESLEAYFQKTDSKLDDVIYKKTLEAIGRAIKGLGFVSDLANNAPHEKAIEQFKIQLKDVNEDVSEALTHKVASIAVDSLSGSKYPLKRHESDLITSLAFTQIKRAIK